MRAAVCRRFGEPMSIEEVALADPGSGEVTVDIAVCAVCHSDVAYVAGAWGGRRPVILGHEAAGTVSRVSPDVANVSVGDRVAVTLVRSCGKCFFCRAGEDTSCEFSFRLDREHPLRDASGEVIRQGLRTAAFAEQVVVHESQVAAVPQAISMEAAALLACGVVTGFGAVVTTAQVPTGASVAVVGVGGVGLNCIQGATHAGADPVIAVDVRDDKLAMARALGATDTINGSTQDAAAAVAALTAGRGADYVFVAVGSAKAAEQSLSLVRRGGTLVIVGMPPTGDLIGIDAANLASNAQRVVGSKMGSMRVARDIPMLANLYLEGELILDRLITGTYSLEQINEAMASARSGDAIRNLIVFDS